MKSIEKQISYDLKKVDKIRRLLSFGCSVQEIAETLSIHRATVTKYKQFIREQFSYLWQIP